MIHAFENLNSNGNYLKMEKCFEKLKAQVSLFKPLLFNGTIKYACYFSWQHPIIILNKYLDKKSIFQWILVYTYFFVHDCIYAYRYTNSQRQDRNSNVIKLSHLRTRWNLRPLGKKITSLGKKSRILQRFQFGKYMEFCSKSEVIQQIEENLTLQQLLFIV